MLIWRHLTRRRRSQHVVWSVVFWLLALKNLDVYWIAYPLAGWMIWALLLILLQLVHNHEFIYRRYWPVFWRLSAYYAGIIFVASLFSHNLPLV
ncbi:hypothetical protein [Limosilactobacillus sp.]|uniref:hypothetical protein n=1 Tax=Limosilactobacillus sp. TaxID=2773925 RepID=UPI0035A0BD22